MPKQSYIATLEGQECVREAVKYYGLTQAQIAAQAGLKTRTSVGHLIQGKRVERGAFKRICNCLDLDYRAIAGLTFPSLPSAALTTDDFSVASSNSIKKSEEILCEIVALKDEVKSLKADLQTRRVQDVAPLLGGISEEESLNGIGSFKGRSLASASLAQEVAVERKGQSASFDDLSLHQASEGNGGEKPQLPSSLEEALGSLLLESEFDLAQQKEQYRSLIKTQMMTLLGMPANSAVPNLKVLDSFSGTGSLTRKLKPSFSRTPLPYRT